MSLSTMRSAVRQDPALISIEALDEEIVHLSARMTAQEYELLVLIRTFDERGGWLKWGSENCADWLHWRCDLSLSAAREKVRVAHALKALEKVSDAFAAGKLTYSKVRALTRVANRANETELVDFALEVSAAIVEQRCQQLRNVQPGATDIARRAHDRRSLTAFRNPLAGSMSLTMEIPLEDGELILTALDRVLATAESAPDTSTPYRVRQADALVQMCKRALAGDRDGARPDGNRISADGDPKSLRGGVPDTASSTSTADQYQVIIHVDRSAMADSPRSEARSDLPVESVRRLSCDGSVVSIESDRNGVPFDIGRKRRTVPAVLKCALWARDRHCRFPGCSHTRFVDAHHVEHWARGGETKLDNLMLLCSHHHRLVHEGGFQIFVDSDGHRSFRRPDGRAVPACGFRVEDQVDDATDTSAEGSTPIGSDTSAEGSIPCRYNPSAEVSPPNQTET